MLHLLASKSTAGRHTSTSEAGGAALSYNQLAGADPPRWRKSGGLLPGETLAALNGVTFYAEAFGDPASPAAIVVHGGPGGDYRYLLNTVLMLVLECNHWLGLEYQSA